MIAWFLLPLDQRNNHPSSMRDDYKLRYRVLIAIAYVANGDLGRAEARLNLLGEQITSHSLAAEAQLFLGEGENENTARAIALLATGLENPNQSLGGVGIGEIPYTTPAALVTVAIDTGTLEPSQSSTANVASSQTPTVTKIPTFTPRPSFTPIPTIASSFILSQYPLICDDEYENPMIEVNVWSATQSPVPGVSIIAQWEGGDDQFVTGLYPEKGYGYADFQMADGQIVQISLPEGNQKTPPLDLPYCIDDTGESYFGVWQVLYIQP